MPYSSLRNNYIVFDVFSKAQLRFGKHYQTSKINVYSTVNRRNICVYRGIAGYKQRTCMNTKYAQSSNFEKDLKYNCIKRWYSDDTGIPKRTLPRLMDFPEIVWPSVIKTLRNWILANLIITPYFDQEFSLPDFINGSKQVAILRNLICNNLV